MWSWATAWSGHRFVEALRSRDTGGQWRVTVLSEESDAAYDRVGLTGYTEHWDRARLALPGNGYAGDELVELILGDAVSDDRPRREDGDHPSGPTDRLRRPGAGDRFVCRSCRRCPDMTCPAATSTAPSTTSTRSGPARWHAGR